jgi:hypothetical protein
MHAHLKYENDQIFGVYFVVEKAASVDETANKLSDMIFYEVYRSLKLDFSYLVTPTARRMTSIAARTTAVTIKLLLILRHTLMIALLLYNANRCKNKFQTHS